MSNSQFQLNQVIQDKLKQTEIKTNRENLIKQEELQPIEGGLAQITTGNIHNILNAVIKKGSSKLTSTLQQNTGIDLNKLASQSTEENLEQLRSYAADKLNNTISQNVPELSSTLNTFSNLNEIHDMVPHINMPQIETPDIEPVINDFEEL